MSGLPRGNGMELFQRRVAVEHAFGRDRDGFVRNASPASFRDLIAASTPGAARFGGTGVQVEVDTFTLTAGAQTLTLSKLPIPNGLTKVSMQGLNLHATDDYTLSSQALSLLAAADARAGMKLEVTYLYLVDLPAPVASPAQVSDSTSGLLTGASPKVTLPASAVAGDLAVVFLQYWATDFISNLSGYTNQGGGTATESNTGYSYTMRVLTKVITSPTDAPTLSQSHGFNGDYIAVVIPGGAVATVAAATSQNQPSGGAASTPAVGSGASTVRCWMAVGNTPRIAGPPGTELEDIPQNTTDMVATSDTSLGAVSTTATATQSPVSGVSWVTATVGVSG